VLPEEPMTAWCLPIPLTLLVCLLALTTSASAECAWVVWLGSGSREVTGSYLK